MKRNLPVIAGLLLLLLIHSCEKQTMWDLSPSARFPVVDCILTNEMKYQELRLHQSSERLNEEEAGISGAFIEISEGNNSVVFREDSLEQGRYLSSEPFRASAGNIYRLVVRFGDFADTAYAEMTAVTPLEAIDILPNDTLFRYIYHNSPRASMMEVYYDWSGDTDYIDRYGAGQASEVFYTLDNIDVEKEFAPDRQIIWFPQNTWIIRRKYSLSTAHQEFVRALLLETEWRGGLFDAEQGNVPTDFSHGIRGWFGACMVLSDTTFFK